MQIEPPFLCPFTTLSQKNLENVCKNRKLTLPLHTQFKSNASLAQLVRASDC